MRGGRAAVREEILLVVCLETFCTRILVLLGDVDLSPGDGNGLVFWRIPTLEKSMDLRGMSSTSGDFGLADRTKGNFLSRQHRAVFAVRFHQLFAKAEGSDDVSPKQLHTADEPPKGLRERLAVDATAGEQVGESAEEDVRTLGVSVDERGQRWKEWKQVCREIQSHSFDDGWSEYHEGPNCTLDMFGKWGRNGSDPVIGCHNF